MTHLVPALKKVLWIAAVPIAIVAGYLALGLGFTAVTGGDSMVVTIMIGVVVFAVVGGARAWRPRWFDYPISGTIRASRRTAPVALLVLGTLVLAFVGGQALGLNLYALIGSDGFDATQQTRSEAPIMLAVLFTVIVAPVTEEMMCRGVMYPLLRKKSGIVTSTIVTVGVFALMHGNVVQIALSIPMAILSTIVYERTRKIAPSVLIHMGFNAAAVVIPSSAIATLAHPALVGIILLMFVGGITLIRISPTAGTATRLEGPQAA